SGAWAAFVSLAPDTAYYARARAVNSAQIPTVWVNLGGVVTADGVLAVSADKLTNVWYETFPTSFNAQGADHYHYKIASSSSDLPSTTAPAFTGALMTLNLSEGIWYFNIRGEGPTHNLVGNASYGPLKIDATPPAPANLTAVPGNGQVTLSWNAIGVADLWYYRIHVDSTPPYDFGDQFLISAASTSASFVHTGLPPGTTYSYFITAVDKGAPDYAGYALESPGSNVVSAMTNPPPAPVANLTAIPGLEGEALLSWTAPEEDDTPFPSGKSVASYIIRLATFSADSIGNATAWWDAAGDAAGEPAPSAPGNSDSMLFNALTPGVTYYFALKSVDGGNNISSIDTKAATPGQQAYASIVDIAPGTPQNFTAVSGDIRVFLNWTDLTPAQKTPDFAHYRLERSTDGANFISVTTATAVSYLDTEVTNGRTYIYHLIAVDKGPPGPALESAPAVVSAIPRRDLLPPAIVAGLSGQLSADGQFFTINWSTVTTNLDGTPITDLAMYRVYKFTGPFASTTAVFDVLQTSFTDTVNSRNLYYKIRAVDTSANESPDSNFINSLTKPDITAAGDDGKTTLTVPGEISAELHKENNSTESDLVIVPVRLSAEETGDVLKSYRFEVRRAENNQPITSFTFSKPLANISFGFVTGSGIDALSIYWHNGARFISLGGHLNFGEGTINILSSNTGRYQLRRLSALGGMVLTEGSPYPRTITPNGDGVNDRVFFFFEATDARKEGRVYDLTGAFVGSMKPGPVQNSSLVWDGKDDRGNVVSRGIYLYKVSLGEKSVTGTVVVAR
ncbi:MAG: hypothetical protein KKH28_08690, partial [Elusimicrobia bacterium]|nr:hypothetical protein [Elusimicrobiota bacterium]